MSLSCYNRGCGKKYEESNNNKEACLHHPGLPYFHDAYKIWSCCEKKSIDFTTFLDLKGCTKSRHNNIPPENNVKKVEKVIEKIPDNLEKQSEKIKRPPESTPYGILEFTISKSLKTHLEKCENQVNKEFENKEEVLAVGTTCKNSGCTATYKSPDDNLEDCIHHTGVPIFHEGMKFWSCCQKKTSDFDAFLQQTGCNVGKHLWIKIKKASQNEDRSRACRFDWFQTANQIVINIYSKFPIPSLSFIEGNPVKISTLIVFEENKQEFFKEFVLNGIIDLKESSVIYSTNKTEISLKKTSPIQWPKLEI